ncbi:MAG: acyl-CoA dehydrogenase [Chitinophagales bacterium]|nr:acyl-CoA dehydrogenase [Chitinophagales bacterium]
MSEIFYSKENLHFLLNGVFDISELCKLGRYNHHTTEGFDMMLEAADSLATKHLRPILMEMDRNPPQLVNGKITVHPAMRSLMKKFGDDGWISMSAPQEHGGLHAPFTLLQAVGFIFAAANYSTMAYPFLSNGAAHLIESFATKDLQQQFIPKIYSGEWQGTMALTEPEAGSSLSDIVTTAEKTASGHYLIKGQKIFISCGDHDACDNVVHLMLARIKGAPAGTKGISLFVVPQKRIDASGSLVSNDVSTAGLFHKMGYHGAPIAHLIMGEKEDCHGYLVGEEHKGLSYMFQMMNEARIGVGMSAVAIASAAYYHSLQYTKVRKQGRKITDKDPVKPQTEIINHADVKRMLLFQKSIVEGSLSLCMQSTWYFDMWKATVGEEKEKYFLLLEILTPIVKSYPAEMSIQTTSAALQCFGGYGFTKDFMAELFFRETRIHTLHEGTTAIHGMDLLGRKVTMQNGKAVQLLLREIAEDMKRAAQHQLLQPYVSSLKSVLNDLQQTTFELLAKAQSKGAEVFLSDATLYLEAFGIVCVAWQWLKQCASANEKLAASSAAYSQEFLKSKQHACGYYFEYELPKTVYLLQRLRSKNNITVATAAEEIV